MSKDLILTHHAKPVLLTLIKKNMRNLKTAREFIKSIKNLENDPNFLNILNEKKIESQNLKNKNTSRLKACLAITVTKFDNPFIGVIFLTQKEIDKKLIFRVEKPSTQIYSITKFIEIL